MKVASDLLVREGRSPGARVGDVLRLLLGYPWGCPTSPAPEGTFLPPGWLLLQPLSPQGPAAAMQSARCLGEPAVQVLLPGMLEASQEHVPSVGISQLSAPILCGTQRFLSLLYSRLHWVEPDPPGGARKVVTPRDLSCGFLAPGQPEAAVPGRS